MDIDRLAIALSRRRLIGAGLFAAIQARAVGAHHDPDHDKPEHKITPTETPTETATPVPTEVPTETPVPTDVPTDVPTETATATEEPTVEPTSTDQATPIPADTETATATSTETATQTTTATATATPAGGVSPLVPPGSLALVAAYWFDPSTGGTPLWAATKYLPRQWQAGLVVDDPSWGRIQVNNPGLAVGCDLWPSINSGGARAQANDQMHRVRLNRDSLVSVVWRAGPVASWLTDWTLAGTVDVTFLDRGWVVAYPVYQKLVSAGDTFFGSAWSPGATTGAGRDIPWFVFAEADGLATPDPGITPNAPCPFHTPGSWHPQIDRVGWCYYGHEHGSDPVHFPWLPAPTFGEVAAKAGMSENDVGFKVYVIYGVDGLVYRIVQHFGTSGPARACAEHHTVEIAAADPSAGLLAHLRFMADFGDARNNDTQAVYTPPACPNQAAESTGLGARQIPAAGVGNSTAYEPWRFDAGMSPALGIGGGITFNTKDQVTQCADMTCNSVVVRSGHSGSNRFVTNADFAIVDPHGLGTFCTDPMGREMVDCGAENAVEQFIVPGLNLAVGLTGGSAEGHCVDRQGWGEPYVCGVTTVEPTERENSIGMVN